MYEFTYTHRHMHARTHAHFNYISTIWRIPFVEMWKYERARTLATINTVATAVATAVDASPWPERSYIGNIMFALI